MTYHYVIYLSLYIYIYIYIYITTKYKCVISRKTQIFMEILYNFFLEDLPGAMDDMDGKRESKKSVLVA